MAKNKNNKKKNVNNKKVIDNIDSDINIKKVFICIILVAIIFGLVYLLTLYITKNSTDSVVKKKFDNTTIQYDEILLGTSFSQKDNEYLVLFYNVSEDEDSTYYTLKSNYEAKDDALAMYYVDLGSALNKSAVSKEDNKTAVSASELKISGPTLIKFKEGKIEEYITGEEDITNYLS